MVTIRKAKEKGDKFWKLNVSILNNKKLEEQIQEHIEKYEKVETMQQWVEFKNSVRDQLKAAADWNNRKKKLKKPWLKRNAVVDPQSYNEYQVLLQEELD